MVIISNTKSKKNPTKVCPRCGKGQPVQVAINFDLRANAAVVHHRCNACGSPVIQFRNMTEAERKAEAKRILAEDEQRRAEEAAKAEREGKAAAEYERERAEIIMQQRRGAGRQR